MLKEYQYNQFTGRQFAFFILRRRLGKSRKEIMRMMNVKKRRYYDMRREVIKIIDPRNEYSRIRDKKVKNRLASA